MIVNINCTLIKEDDNNYTVQLSFSGIPSEEKAHEVIKKLERMVTELGAMREQWNDVPKLQS
jgi:hypothetical protein